VLVDCLCTISSLFFINNTSKKCYDLITKFQNSEQQKAIQRSSYVKYVPDDDLISSKHIVTCLGL
jgi:hypothetical protein